jgi:hypothetical protein
MNRLSWLWLAPIFAAESLASYVQVIKAEISRPRS